jgi:transketolase
MLDNTELRKKACQLRIDTLKLIVEGQAGHIGGDLSQIEILTTLFYDVMRHNPRNPRWELRDRFILSKGHCVEAYYCTLVDLGYFPRDMLLTYNKYGTQLIGHPNNKLPGIEVNSGSLGHGLSVGVGMAVAAKLDNRSYKVYVLMGDGELAEGSIWEAAMAASDYRLDNLCAIIDRNHLQISGNTEDTMKLEPLKDKWESFGFEVIEVDGHDIQQLQDALTAKVAKPKLVMANTIKGKGISFLENIAKWHHGVPSAEQLELAMCDLNEGIS